jgi:hypothetical protein
VETRRIRTGGTAQLSTSGGRRMTTSFRGMAGRLAIALLLVLLAAGSALAAATSLPGLANGVPAEESAAPSASAPPEASAEPAGSPAGEASAAPTTLPAPASPVAPPTPEPVAPASREAEGDEDADDDMTPSLANLERIVARLDAVGIATTTDELADLASRVGVGGAVRVLLFADASGSTPTAILARFEAGTGWGVIAKELGVHPGLGAVMGNGRGHDPAAKAAAKAERARERAERKAGSGD